LGSSQAATFEQTGSDLTIHSEPGEASQYPVAFQISFKN